MHICYICSVFLPRNVHKNCFVRKHVGQKPLQYHLSGLLSPKVSISDTRVHLSCSKPAMRSAQCWIAWKPANQTRFVSKWGWLRRLRCLYWRLGIPTEKAENIKSHSTRLILLQWNWNRIPLGTSAAILRRKTLDFTWLQPDWAVEVQKFSAFDHFQFGAFLAPPFPVSVTANLSYWHCLPSCFTCLEHLLVSHHTSTIRLIRHTSKPKLSRQTKTSGAHQSTFCISSILSLYHVVSLVAPLSLQCRSGHSLLHIFAALPKASVVTVVSRLRVFFWAVDSHRLPCTAHTCLAHGKRCQEVSEENRLLWNDMIMYEPVLEWIQSRVKVYLQSSTVLKVPKTVKWNVSSNCMVKQKLFCNESQSRYGRDTPSKTISNSCGACCGTWEWACRMLRQNTSTNSYKFCGQCCFHEHQTLNRPHMAAIHNLNHSQQRNAFQCLHLDRLDKQPTQQHTKWHGRLEKSCVKLFAAEISSGNIFALRNHSE